jgi:hypothetical protein
MSKLDCSLLEVNLDGSADYTSIQTAINSANDNDVILVHPGRYIERLNTNGKDLTLQSLYALEPLPEYIDSTIVDGDRQVCLRIENGENVTINGFTFSNNYDDLNVVDTNQIDTVGGGIKIFDAGYVEVKNTKTVKNVSRGGAGISVYGNNTSAYFENVEITENRALAGGGLRLSSGAQIECNNLRVYNNYAIYAMDIFIGNYNDYQGTHIELSMGSAILNEIDNYYVLDAGNSSPPYEPGIGNVTISVQEAYFPEIDQDLYVSPLGSNDNSGLSPSESLQTLVRAMQMIKSNPNNPHTVHVAAGTYSWSENNQRFPFSLKANAKLLGAGIDQTIIEGESGLINIGVAYSDNLEFGGMTFQNSSGYSYAPVWGGGGENVYIHDLKYDRTTHINTTGFSLSGGGDYRLENIIIQNNNSHTYSDLQAMYLGNGDYSLNNIIIRNNKMFHADNQELGIYAVNCNLDIRNLIITDCQGEDATLLNYYVNQEIYSDCTFEMHNASIFDNNVFTGPGSIRPVGIKNIFSEDYSILISNCTIANNYGNREFAGAAGRAKVYNSIFYNPECLLDGELNLSNRIQIDNQWVPMDSHLYNNLFYSESPFYWNEDYVEQGDNLFSANPHFLGEFVDSLDVSDVDYYRLSDNSPCIDAGFSDTSFLNSTDLLGNYRVWGDAVDIGAFEYSSEPYVSNDEHEVEASPAAKILIYPNPVSRSKSKGRGISNIEFVIPKQIKDKPRITIYNLRGQKVKSIAIENSYQDMQKHAGLKTNYAEGQLYSTNWNLRNESNKEVASGLYIIKVKAGSYLASGKMMLLK